VSMDPRSRRWIIPVALLLLLALVVIGALI
jgi:hypothetical protein